MKKNIGDYNEKNVIGIKKIDKILGNDEPSDDVEENNQQNENNEDIIDNFLPPSLKLNNNKYNTNFNYNDDDNIYQIKQEDKNLKNKTKNNIGLNTFNNNYLDKNESEFFNSNNNNYTKIEKNNINKNDINPSNFKRKSFGDNSVNLAELNQKIKNSTDKNSSYSFISPTNNNFLKQNDFEDKYDFTKEDNDDKYNNNDNNLYPNEIRYEDYNDNKKENSFNFYNDINDNNNIENKTEIIKPKLESNIINNNKKNNTNNKKQFNNNNYNFDYSNKLKIMKKNNNNFIFDKNKNIFYSLQIDNNIPTNVSDFGKFLISHIEKEENYKTLFNRELKSFKNKIKKIFTNSRTTDHCLTDYLFDIWDKLEISYSIRYQILNNIIKLDANNLYLFLDRETEYLTNYFQISEQIFQKIKKRENIKSKLQIKTNRNEFILPGDREELERITQDLEENIKIFKNKYKGMNIIWKGIFYEWFMNYEKWFYEMELRNDFEYLN